MPFIGNKPSAVPLTSADITDGIIVNADISSTAGITLNKISGNPNFRNIVINGDMQIAQRSTSVASITTSGYNTVDRWTINLSSLGTWTQSQSTDVPSGYGFSSSLKMDCTTANASPAASNNLNIQQRFEGQNLQYLKKGTANALSLTASFWVKSTKTGTFICNLQDSNNTRLIAKSYTISVSNTWEFKTITFEGDTTGAFTNDNARSLDLAFYLGAGTDYTSGTLQTTWGTTVTANRAVGQVNCADSTSNDFLITGVQLEAGTSASDFEFLPIDVDLARCYRYYYRLKANGANYPFSFAQCYGTTTGGVLVPYQVTMRTAPSALEQSGTAADYQVYSSTGSSITLSAVPTYAGVATTPAMGAVNFTVASGLVAGNITQFTGANSSAYLAWSAEL